MTTDTHWTTTATTWDQLTAGDIVIGRGGRPWMVTTCHPGTDHTVTVTVTAGHHTKTVHVPADADTTVLIPTPERAAITALRAAFPQLRAQPPEAT